MAPCTSATITVQDYQFGFGGAFHAAENSPVRSVGRRLLLERSTALTRSEGMTLPLFESCFGLELVIGDGLDSCQRVSPLKELAMAELHESSFT
ncbi:hypothetical protein KR51_00037880 [Rubidibacter lacunae KORDI 51-2]|uniref:Uncharacterized protein n=1 Tax=Rubidibacter lacunae KORDI 51-2 TaxID=582515 RepID=U5D512_9CHRO|nr:hypothetical protein KR51_00037880 [Rubidibacter lacunae KORDI 51-2]